MATESPVRISEMSRKWPTHQESGAFTASSTNVAAEDLRLVQRGQRLHANGTERVPNRSGSAPPSMEGSYLAIDNLISQQNLTVNVNSASLNTASEKSQSEEQLCADPAYLAYYSLNVNLNPRLPPPLVSWGNQHLKRHTVRVGNDPVLDSIDDSGNSVLHYSKGSPYTHKEVAEDDHTPQQSSDDLIEKNDLLFFGQNVASLVGQPKESVNLVQDNFSMTSPVYTQSQSIGDSNSLLDISIGTSTLNADLGLSSRAIQTSLPSSSSSSNTCTTTTSSMPYSQKGLLHYRDIYLKDEVVGSARSADVSVVESEIKDLNISTLRLGNSENYKNQGQKRHNYRNNLMQKQGQLRQPSNPFQVQTAKYELNPQGVNSGCIGIDHFMQAPFKFSPEVQPVLQSSGFTPPLYATQAGYMTTPNQFYPNVQAPGLQSPHGLHSPQYVVGGYGFSSSAIPPFITHPPHGAVPFVFDGSMGPNFNAQVPGASSGGSIANGVNTQHLNKFYGQFGHAVDPLYMQYYQQPVGEAYGISGQYDPLAMGGIVGSQNSAFDSQKGSNLAAYPEYQKIQNHQGGGSSNLHIGRGLMSSHYFGNVQNIGILMQSSYGSLASPIMPGSQIAGTCVPIVKNEVRYADGSGVYSGWQGQRGFESSSDPKIYNFLEELKSGKGRRFELSDIVGHIVEFSADQHGSRFIQQKLETCSIEEKASVFEEVLPHASKLMTDVFGNYVIQKFLEYGSPEQRKELATKLSGQILNFSLQMYGCRVIQKALEVIDLDKKAQLVRELEGHVMRCVHDQNGNHVIQKCIESVPTDRIGFVISSFRGQVAKLSTHPYGCRVIQRVLEHCTGEQQCYFIVDEILESVCALAQDQYGNYVTQQVLERGNSQERSKIISKLSGHIVHLSQHKFASNVIEKCLEYGGPSERQLVVEEIVAHTEGNDHLLVMMKDQFANYVVQKILETCTDSQLAMLLSRIRLHAHVLKKYTYGKRIVSRFEQLFGEEDHTMGS